MDFSEALNKLKKGHALKRIGWNGKKLYVITHKSDVCGDMFVIVNEEKDTINSWHPSISDLYAEDWEIYKETYKGDY